ncbi:MAG: hypothetical protein ABSA17_07495 [Rhabdochlamydiaceae bacterium]|jgi:hypothetical protein
MFAIPSPINNLIMGPARIKKAYQDAAVEGDRLKDAEKPAEKMIKASLRIVIAAIGVFSVYKLNVPFKTALNYGVCISLPSVAVAMGSASLCKGIITSVGAVTGSEDIYDGLASLFWGYAFFKFHDELNFGFVEWLVITPLANYLKTPLIKYTMGL